MTIDPNDLPPRMDEGDPRGPLTFVRPLPEPYGSAEDSTLAADHERVHAVGRRFTRPATATEIELLTVLGFRDYRGDPPGPETMTRVEWVSTGVRRREWPDLYAPTTIEPTTPGGAL